MISCCLKYVLAPTATGETLKSVHLMINLARCIASDETFQPVQPSETDCLKNVQGIV